MDISKAKRNSREDVPEHIAPYKRGSAQYSGNGGAGGMRRPSYDEMRQQFEEMKERNRVQRGQLQAVQTERDKAIDGSRRLQENSKFLLKKVDDMKRELDYAQRGQISRFDHEKLAKHYEQVCAQNHLLQHEKERLEQHFSQERQEVEGRLLDDLKNTKLNLEEAERDRDSLRYKLSEKKRELDRLNEQLKCLGPNQDTKKEINKVLNERDILRNKLSELKQEKQGIQEKLKTATKSLDAMKSQMPEDQKISDLQLQVGSLQLLVDGLRREKDEMAEANNELRRNLEVAEIQLRETDMECQRLRHAMTELRGISPSRRVGPVDKGSGMPLSHGSSEEMLTIKRFRNSVASRGRSQGSTEDDCVSSDNSQNPNSMNDLAALTRSNSGQIMQLSGGGMAPLSVTHSGGEPVTSVRRKLGKFSSSASNLSNEMYERPPAMSGSSNKMLLQKTIRLEKSLEEAKKENSALHTKVSELEHDRGGTSVHMEELEKTLESVRGELTKSSKLFKNSKNQIDMLNKEKGVAMRDNAASYEHSIQMETQLRELQAEKQILDQRKGIAEKEMERVITESVSNKKKLEAIKSQRQKDGNELNAMRHLKEKALQEAKDMKKRLDEIRNSRAKVEEELATIRETVHRAAVKLSPRPRQKGVAGSPSGLARSTEGGGLTQDLAGIMERLHHLENERKIVIKKLFGLDSQSDQAHPLADILHKVESLLRERDDLLVEIEALQLSSSKLTEDRIYELKQRIEDLLMDGDSMESENKSMKREINSLSSVLVKTEQERDKLSMDCERLHLQCQQFKSRQARLVEEHTKTLERVTELWKQKWPVNWDDAWEEKHASVPLDQDGLAGFSVVGGRDQPHVPNPGAFIITVVNPGGPAEGLLKPGDILESVNGINLSNADHREAVRAVKETKRNLSIVFKRRRNVYPISVGIIQPVNNTPQLTPMPATEPEIPEQVEYSLYITGKEKSDLGFRYDWSTVCTVSAVTGQGPADQILQKGDRIVKVNKSDITHEKPSTVKKLMKPQKNILRLTIERLSRNERTYMGQQPQMPLDVSWSPSLLKSSVSAPTIEDSPSLQKRLMYGSGSNTPMHKEELESDYTQQSLTSHASFSTLDKLGERAPVSCKDSSSYVGGGATNFHYKTNSRDSSSSRDSYSDTQSQDSGNKPTKLVSMVTCVKNREQKKPAPLPVTRPSSDGVMYGNFNERRIEYEEVLESERSDSQFSQSESYLSESSYDYGLSSSQSIDLTFHTVSTIPTHNRLTVDTVMTTQAPSQQSEDEDGVGFLARNDASRTTFRTRNPGDPLANSNTNNSEIPENTEPEEDSSQLAESQTLSQEFKRDRRGLGNGLRRKQRRRHSNGSRGFNKSNSDQNLAKVSGSLSMWGRSRSNLSLGRAPSMTSVLEEPRRSTSTTDMMVYDRHDPLEDATYIIANFTYIPRTPKELHIKSGDVFHIHDEAPPERFRSSFWVSRLNADGTDEQIGAIPNSMKAQDYLETQGECLDFELYEEVEAYIGRRPVVIFGALADQVVMSLLESFPKMFYPCATDHVEGVARLTEARLRRDVTEGRIVDFRHIEGGFEVVRMEAITRTQNKSKHCLMTGTPQALQTLKAVAPPITILVKAMTQESITTFSPEHISQEQAKEIFDAVTELDETHRHEFSASLFLIYMETLMNQIEVIIKAENRKQAWVPIAKNES